MAPIAISSGTREAIGEEIPEFLVAAVTDGAVEAGRGGQTVQVGEASAEVLAFA